MMFDGRIYSLALGGQLACGTASTAAGASGQYSHVQVRNVASSGKRVHVLGLAIDTIDTVFVGARSADISADTESDMYNLATPFSAVTTKISRRVNSTFMSGANVLYALTPADVGKWFHLPAPVILDEGNVFVVGRNTTQSSIRASILIRELDK